MRCATGPALGPTQIEEGPVMSAPRRGQEGRRPCAPATARAGAPVDYRGDAPGGAAWVLACWLHVDCAHKEKPR